MGLREQQIEDVTDLVRRYCAVENMEEPQDGYFAFYQGGTSRKASKQVRASVAWGDVAKVTAAVIRRVTELATNGEGHVFVRAFEKGSSSPCESLKVEGSTESMTAEEEEPADSGAIGTLTGVIRQMTTAVMSENRELRERIHRGWDDRLVEREQFTMSLMHNQMLEASADDQRMSAAIQALAPTIEAVTPAVIAAVMKFMQTPAPGAPPELPADPPARFDALVASMVLLAQQMGGVAQGMDRSLFTPERKSNLYILVQQLAPFLGLTVTGYPEQPTTDGATS